jgi:hypothetical protein
MTTLTANNVPDKYKDNDDCNYEDNNNKDDGWQTMTTMLSKIMTMVMTIIMMMKTMTDVGISQVDFV